MATELQKGKSILRPRARLIKTIGEDLISNDIVAVLELVKNSYDADASIISITFTGNVETIEVGEDKKATTKKTLKKDGAMITIYDDGCGMSLETIEKAWMEPATTMKKSVKNSPSKLRRYTGEKGIGRFASAKLSSKLNIVTKVQNDNEVVVDFDWNDFSDDSKYLDQVESHWEVRSPQVFPVQGTVLSLVNLNSDWDEEKFQALKIALSRLVNPVSPVEDFLIELNVPEQVGNFNGLISSPTSIQKPDYSIRGSVNELGVANFVYFSKKRGEITLEKDLSKTLFPIRIPKSGSFDFELRVWDRETDSLGNLAKEVKTTTKNIRADLDQLSGVSIYRDNFRVLPYGEPKNDWLRLNARRINNPTLRLSDNQVVGYISVGLDHNSGLQDQSNREGIVESTAFTDLQEQIRSLLNELEIKRYEERPRREVAREASESLYASFSIDNLVSALEKRHPDDKELIHIVQQTQVSIEKGVTKIQEVLSRYRRLSTLGQLVDSILHDGGQFLLGLDSQIRLLQKELNKKDRDDERINKYVVSIQEQRRLIAQLFERVAPFGGRRRGKPTKIVVEDSIKNVFHIWHSEIEKLNIETSLPDGQSTVTIDNGELQMILINLLQNSLYWLSGVEHDNRKICVEVEKNDDELVIIFSDSGPGIPEDKAEFIFDPYYTTRPDGAGLGLTIVGELAAEYNGELHLISNGPLDGATFRISFRTRI